MQTEKKVSRFRKIHESDLEMIMHWRMMPEITRYMRTDPKLTMEQQLKWYQKIKNDSNSLYWIYEAEGEPAGLITLQSREPGSGIYYAGSYIAEKKARTLENIINMNMNLDGYPFEHLNAEKLMAEIMGNNTSQLWWVKRFGMVPEGIKKEEILKNNEYFDLHIFRFNRKEWETASSKIHYQRFEIEE